LSIWATTTIGKSIQAAILATLDDLVAGLVGDIELAAQRRHLLAVKQTGFEPQTLIYWNTPDEALYALRKVQKYYP
jgi:hypothetical protein